MADENVIILATLTPKAGREAEMEALLRAMCEPSRAEPGCVTYNLFRSRDDGTFHFFEVWETQADLDAHRETPHYKEFRAGLGDVSGGPPSPNYLLRVDSKV